MAANIKNTLVDLFENSVERYNSKTFMLEKKGKNWLETTYAQTKEQVLRFGAGLVELGVRPKDNMALLSEGRNSWIIGELAMFYAGAVNVPLSVKLEEKNDLMFRLQHSDSKYIMVSASQLPKIRAIKNELPEIKSYIVFDYHVEHLYQEIFLSDLC